jgi:hypothetical protein
LGPENPAPIKDNTEDKDDQSDYETAYEDDDDNHKKTFHINSRSLVSENKRNIRWTPDTAVSSHMTDRFNLFEKDSTVNETGARTVTVGNNKLPILDRGTVRI